MFPKRVILLLCRLIRSLVTNKKADDLQLSSAIYLFNKATGLAIVCPITNTNRKIPFHLTVQSKSSLTGFVMVEQVKSVDFISRKVKFVEKAPQEFIDDIIAIIDICIK